MVVEVDKHSRKTSSKEKRPRELREVYFKNVIEGYGITDEDIIRRLRAIAEHSLKGNPDMTPSHTHAVEPEGALHLAVNSANNSDYRRMVRLRCSVPSGLEELHQRLEQEERPDEIGDASRKARRSQFEEFWNENVVGVTIRELDEELEKRGIVLE